MYTADLYENNNSNGLIADKTMNRIENPETYAFVVN